MPEPVLHVGWPGVPAQVRWSVVCRITIVVAALKTSRSRAHEGSEHKGVYPRFPTREDYPEVSRLCAGGEDTATTQLASGSISSGKQHYSINAADPTFRTHLIRAVISSNRSPLLHSHFRPPPENAPGPGEFHDHLPVVAFFVNAPSGPRRTRIPQEVKRPCEKWM